MVTHDARAAAIAHRVLFLADGSIFRELGECDAHDDPHRHGRARRGVIKVALRGLAGRKLRAVLTAIAIVLGVAMISGTYILTDTINSAFTTLFTESYAGTDAVVTGRGLDISIDGERRRAPPVDASLLDTVRGVEGVALATGTCSTSTTRRSSPRRRSPSAPRARRRSDSESTRARRRPVQPAEALRGPLARRRPTRSSSTWARPTTRTTRSATRSRSRHCSRSARSSSSASRSTAASTASGTRASRSSRSRPRRSFSIARGSTTRSRSRRTEGLSEDELVAAIEPALPADAKVVSATAEAEEQVEEVNEFTAFFRYFLLAFAGIALFVGAFVIFNTFSITVAQRTREFATLRTIGASRRQVLGSVILESLVIGLLASLVGLGLGVLLAEGIKALFGSFGIELPIRGSRLRDADGGRLADRRRGYHAARRPCSPPSARRACRRSRRCAKAQRFAVVAICPASRPGFHRAARRRRRGRRFSSSRARCSRRRSSAPARPAACSRSPPAVSPALRRCRDALVGASSGPIAAAVGLPGPEVAGSGVAGVLAQRQRRPQSRPDGRDRGGADDRHRARLVHRDADERDEGVEPRGDRGADRSPTTS